MNYKSLSSPVMALWLGMLHVHGAFCAKTLCWLYIFIVLKMSLFLPREPRQISQKPLGWSFPTWHHTVESSSKSALCISLNVQLLGAAGMFPEWRRSHTGIRELWILCWRVVSRPISLVLRLARRWHCLLHATFFPQWSGRRGLFQLPLMRIKLPMSDGRLLFHTLPFLFQQKFSCLFLLAEFACCTVERRLHVVRGSAVSPPIHIHLMVRMLPIS